MIAASWPRHVKAQTESWTSPYPMILTPTRALAFVQAAREKLDFVPNEVLVKFKSGITSAGQQRALMALRSRPSVSTLRWVGDFAVLTDRQEWNATILAEQLREQPEVVYAEPNYLYHFNSTPNDPGFANAQWNFSVLDMPRAWDISPGGNANVTVAVVDSGVTEIDKTYIFPMWNGSFNQDANVPFRINPDLASGRIVSPHDVVFWGGPVLDMDGHGTHVSSTIAEDTNNNLAEAGMAYNVKIMPVKVCLGFWEIQFRLSASGYHGFAPLNSGGCPTASMAEGIRYAADSGAKVINMSAGGPQPSIVLQDAVNYAVSRGVFVSLSGGNDYETGNKIDYPAAYASTTDGAMSVAAVGRSLTRAYYSNTGSYVEIAAPGGNVRDGGSSGLIWQTTLYPPDSNAATVIFPRFDRYAETPLQGTSMAAPHVAGTAALLVSQGITNPSIIEALIKKTARDLGPGGRDNEYGYGLVQPRAALFGFGIAK
jgi:subtilisin family serine protease